MRIDFGVLPGLRRAGQALTEDETKKWIEGLTLDGVCDLDEDSVTEFWDTFVLTNLPQIDTLEPQWITGITRWAGEERLHLLSDWVISHPEQGVVLLDAFVRVKTSEALLQLQMVAYSRASTELVRQAWKLLDEVAGRQGLRIWELQDLIVPRCGMSKTEPWPIDFGAQRFGIRLDSDLAVVLVSESRRILKSLPTPITGDDPDKVSDARHMFGRVLADLEDTLPTQMMRFENALVEQLRWRVGHWLEAILNHPVLTHLAQRLIWGVYTQGGRCVGSFRVGDDGNLSDSEDGCFELQDDCLVGVLHPLDITEVERHAWGVVLADYELPTLFPQMDRPLFLCPPDQKKATQLRRVVKRDLEWGRSHLISRGWEIEDGNRSIVRVFRTSDILVELRLVEEQENLVEVSATFRRFLGHPQHSFQLRDVPKVVFSETCLELESLIHS